MTGDMNIQPLPQATATTRAPMVSGELLKLLTPAAGLIATGQTAQAEVLSLKQADQTFQLLLKVTLESGRQTTVQATSSQPLPQGTSLAVTQPSASNLAITVQQALASSVATLTRIDTSQMPVGTLLQGKVITSQALPQAPGQPVVYRSLVSLLNTAQAGRTLDIDSPRPLRIGTLLSAQVQDAQTLKFIPLSNRQEQLAVSQQLVTQVSRQGSLDSLISALQNLPVTDDTGSELRAVVTRLLASLPDVQQLSTPKGLAQALAASGAFLESKLLAGQPPALAPDLKGDLLKLVAQLTPALPASTNLSAIIAANTLAQALPSFVRNALGTLGQVSAKPQPTSFPLPSRLLKEQDDEGDLEHLLRLAAAAVSRLQSHQLSSLEQTGLTDDGRLMSTWQLEIPMRNLQDIVPLQVKFQREQTPPREQSNEPREEREPRQQQLWRVELAFDMEPLGPLQVQVQLLSGSLSSQLWAQRPYTASLIESNLAALRERLVTCGLNVGDLDCHLGTPPQGPKTRLEQRWVDETA
ncbi:MULTISPECIES: flagellar hook-length control protein FliK [Pseudomonas]|uniref:flagellar hook-length control protein FliK n=1 Tax=Pseudomonas TaxID=286 RepID=UPI000908B185|nr:MULTISPECIES: flagellar hook-length control protein FliK [Pseudomonas]MDT8904278.1 flagellar hook-length control protein FliK [Pseudomonas prosekii]NHN69350.1 flagellar hook-length control protein FliK [Pseudomonas fluorescens]ROO33882.1 flagellar hook-length control protein FliK [Pseudomonas sp. AF76]SFW30351.1 hook-length control protein FliK [Pseudomonas sp. NFACC09-4]SFW99849.1 hook-length control protein FliK [Pseudomonas sp. NFACC47-1]